MKKHFLTCLAISIVTLASSITAFAAPEVMPDGAVFDAEYYAQNNPDVVQAFGTDRDSLYSHYVNHGKAEGRLPVAAEMTGTATQDTQVSTSNELMEEVYSKVINISTTNIEEFYAYVAANLENIKNASTFVESKECVTLIDGIPKYMTYYYTYVAKDGQRLNMIVNMGDNHYVEYGLTSDVGKPSITIEFIVDPEIVDSTRPRIRLRSRERTYEHYILLNEMNYTSNQKNYYVNGNRFCEFRTFITKDGNRNFQIVEEDSVAYLNTNLLANSHVTELVISIGGVDPSRITHTN